MYVVHHGQVPYIKYHTLPESVNSREKEKFNFYGVCCVYGVNDINGVYGVIGVCDIIKTSDVKGVSGVCGVCYTADGCDIIGVSGAIGGICVKGVSDVSGTKEDD